MLMSVLGDVAHAGGVSFADGGIGDVNAVELYGAGLCMLKAGYAVNKLGLTVAVDACNADDLALAHLERHIFDRIVFVQFRGNREVFDLEDDIAGLGGLFVNMEADISADHHGGKLLGGGFLRLDRADALALAQNSAAVCDRHYLVELVGDKQNALALGRKVFHDLHEILDLLRGQNCGRLVENEYLIISVKHLEYLGALLHADGDVLDDGVGFNMQTVLFAQLDDTLSRLALFENTELIRRLNAEDDVIKDGEALNQLKVLVHHADAKRIRIVGVVYLDLNAVLLDDAVLGLIQAEKHAHKRGFTCAVFTEQGVDLAFFQLQGNVVVCDYTGKNLSDVQHFYCKLLIQVYLPPPVF